MPKILALAGGTSAASRTNRLARHVLDRLAATGAATECLLLGDLDPTELARCDVQGPSATRLAAAVAAADGILVATPIYKASFAGLVKLALDVLPQFGLTDKVVFPLATAGGLAHVLALDYALRPVLQSMGARHIVQSIVVTDADWQEEGFAPRTAALLEGALAQFTASLAIPA